MVSRSSPSDRPVRRGRVAPRAPGTEPGDQLIYGKNPVREALRGRRRVRALLLAERGAGQDLESALLGWSADTPGRMPPVRRMATVELTALLGTGEHQGIAAEVDPYPYLDPPDLFRGLTLLVALDGVQDPHNLGAIIRTAEGAGAGVVIPRRRATAVTAAVVKASAGATEHAAVARVRNLTDFLGEAKQAGFWVYGAAAGAGSPYTTQDYRPPTCFVLGSEGEGLGRRVAAQCDAVVSLPLAGRIDSLNVSVSAGILLYEALRQRT